jgi:hypothetical protein
VGNYADTPRNSANSGVCAATQPTNMTVNQRIRSD